VAASNWPTDFGSGIGKLFDFFISSHFGLISIRLTKLQYVRLAKCSNSKQKKKSKTKTKEMICQSYCSLFQILIIPIINIQAGFVRYIYTNSN